MCVKRLMVQIEILKRFDVCVGRYIAAGGCQKWRWEWIKRLHAIYRANGVCATNSQNASLGGAHTHTCIAQSRFSVVHTLSHALARCSRSAPAAPLPRTGRVSRMLRPAWWLDPCFLSWARFSFCSWEHTTLFHHRNILCDLYECVLCIKTHIIHPCEHP